jgi:serine/threonine protein kinase
MAEGTLRVGSPPAHYEIVGKLGAGGMGEVDRAYDQGLDRDVAIKVLPSSLSRRPGRMGDSFRSCTICRTSGLERVVLMHPAGESSSLRHSVT